MRLAFLPDGTTPNAMYRSIGPMLTLEERGHEVRKLEPGNRGSWPETLRWCDLLHIHRVCDSGVVELARAARAAGAAVVWDDDDDVTRAPRHAVSYAVAGGRKGTRRLAERARLFESVDLVTAPSPVLAETFRAGGAPEVRVIENYVMDRLLAFDRRPTGSGVRIGWVAGLEHHLDVERLPVAAALDALLDARPDVHVTTIGLRLPLSSDRYEHREPIPFERLMREVAAFDVGIAPLSPEWTISRARSNVKLKEYASVGVPWLASPIGPYAGLGEKQGGRLVADDRWFEELDELAGSSRRRRRLAKRASRWARTQWITHNVDCWERAFAYAVERARNRTATPNGSSATASPSSRRTA